MVYDSRNKSLKFSCPETLCILYFKTETEMFSHIATGAHKYVQKNVIDEALLYYARQKHLKCSSEEGTPSNYTNVERTIVDHDDVSIQNFVSIFPQGWARKVRRFRRWTPKQKSFIENLFQQGASNKVKFSAEQMAERMRDHMVDGAYYFYSDEYMEPSGTKSNP